MFLVRTEWWMLFDSRWFYRHEIVQGRVCFLLFLGGCTVLFLYQVKNDDIRGQVDGPGALGIVHFVIHVICCFCWNPSFSLFNNYFVDTDWKQLVVHGSH